MGDLIKNTIQRLFSTPSLGLLTLSAVSAFLTLAAHSAFLFPAALFLGLWAAYVAFPWLTAPQEQYLGGPASRPKQITDIEAALRKLRPHRRWWQEEDPQVLQRFEQPRRIADLEQIILTDISHTPSGIDILTPELQVEVTRFVDQAMALAQRRVGLLRALALISEPQLRRELAIIKSRLSQAGPRARQELEKLREAKEEEVRAYQRLQDDLTITEAHLDSIETFLRQLIYEKSINLNNVNEQIGRLKERVEARKESAADVIRAIKAAG